MYIHTMEQYASAFCSQALSSLLCSAVPATTVVCRAGALPFSSGWHRPWPQRSGESWDSSLQLRTAPRFTSSRTRRMVTLPPERKRVVWFPGLTRLALRLRPHQCLPEKIISRISNRARKPIRLRGSRWGGRAFTAGGTQTVMGILSSHSRQMVTKLASTPACSCLAFGAVHLPHF